MGILRNAREGAEMSMQDAAQKLSRLCSGDNGVIPISAERIGRIERNEESAQSEEIYSLAIAYDDPSLCYEYCNGVCRLGKNIVPHLNKTANLGEVTLALLGSVREFEEMEKRLTILAADGRIDCIERKEFERIVKVLDRISENVQTLKFWARTHIAD